MDPLTSDQARQDSAQRKLRLQSLRLNSPDAEPEFDRTARIAASLTQAPIAMVNFINDQRQMFRGMYVPPANPDEDTDGASPGISFDLSDIPETPDTPREAPNDHGFCPHVVAQGSQLALDDVFDYPRYKGNPLVNEMGVRSYLGTPLRDHTGMLLGTVCVADVRPRKWDRERKEVMQQLADSLVTEFRLRDSLLSQQQELFAIFDGAPFPIMLTEGPEHLLRYANGMQGAAFGKAPRLSPGRRALPDLDHAGVFKAMDSALHTGRINTLPKTYITTNDSFSSQAYTFTCTPVRLSPTAPVSGVLTVGMNVTHQPADDQHQRIAASLSEQVQRLGPDSPR